MDVDEVIVFICYSFLDNYFKYLCLLNDLCFEVYFNFRICCLFDFDYNGGLDVIFLVDVFDGVIKDDYKIGFKFV